MKKVNRGWLLTISHNTRSRELYMRLSTGILKQTEERTFSYNVSFICATLWSSLQRPEIQLSGKQLDKLMKERSVESCSIQWHHYRLQVRECSCHCMLKAWSLNHRFHSIISVLLFFIHKIICYWSQGQNEWLYEYLGWVVAAISMFLHFQVPLKHQFSHLLNKAPLICGLASATPSNHSPVVVECDDLFVMIYYAHPARMCLEALRILES